MNTLGTQLKILGVVLGIFASGGSMIWYASAKSEQIIAQEKHLEFDDARLNIMTQIEHDLELRIVHLEDAARH